MIDLTKYSIFSKHISTLKDTSLDNRDGHLKYMISSCRNAVNFDDVKDEYVQNLRLSEIPKSNDAIFNDGKGNLVFVEFKNGYIDRQKQFDIRKKIYDSILIFSDITSTTISNMRNCVNYILVYNETANSENISEKMIVEKNKQAVQPSSSFDIFAKSMGKLSHKEYICFGLTLFQNYCFKEVHTYTEAEFSEYISSL